MTLVATPIIGALAALLFLALSVRVVTLRLRHQVGLGDGGHPDLERAMRAHGNFVEYVPLILILLVMLELNGRVPLAVPGVLGGMLLVGRLLHAQGLSRRRGASFGRQAGIVLTWFSLVGSALLNLLYASRII